MHLIDEGEEPEEIITVIHPLKCTSTYSSLLENPGHTALASVGMGLGERMQHFDGPSPYRLHKQGSREGGGEGHHASVQTVPTVSDYTLSLEDA